MRYTPALAHAEHLRLQAARLGCPLARAVADIKHARAYNTAQAEQAEADYQADPEGFLNRRHDDALAADDYLRTPSR